ncbi:AB-hydrolase YheT [Coemansia reversa NRRL 1564]|uniref:AB-hydrolase YheT n=1 Tax=Coemansia reversa (strain ATCC 12441 / NRRL 1564) TaxID=763665 RepID=A0A2G5B9M8_COERN|nr:AB-hydrolase YheT [Coemansia reversa NRRL 1564]|eukprot:PIA15718.1 AB-hydrolase YheT [Coemansia reversa NRRL 1564]
MVTLHDVLQRECPSLVDPDLAYMIPTPYLGTGLLQTIYATLRVRLRNVASDVSYKRELLVMQDGGTISLDWYSAAKEQNCAECPPIAMMMAGVGGSSREHHLRVMAKALAHSQAAFKIVVVNHRGTARTPITSPRPYDSGFTDDFRAAVKYVRNEYPQSKIVGIGFSMGANILTKYIGEEGPRCTLACAVAICCPFDLQVSSAAINESNLLNDYVIQPSVMSTLMRAIKRASHLQVDPLWNLDLQRVKGATRLCELEEELMVKIGGHRDLNDYYEKSSSFNYVDNIEVPFLAINSLDDRITPPQGIPMDKFLTNPNIALALVPHGGHLGFLTGVPPRIWFVKPIEEFVSAIIR